MELDLPGDAPNLLGGIIILNDIRFRGNYTAWDNVENNRLADARILRTRGEKSSVPEVLNTIIPYEDKGVLAKQP